MTRALAVVVITSGVLALAATAHSQQVPLVGVAETPPQEATAVVIAPPGGLCRELVTQFANAGGGVGDLRDRCTELVQAANAGKAPNQVRNGLEQMSPVKVPTAALSSLALSALQFTTITARLAALRTGVGGISLGGIAQDDWSPALGPRVASADPTSVVPAVTSEATNAPPRFGVFLNGIGAFGSKDGTSRSAGFDFSAAGVVAGADYRVLSNLILGAAFSYTASSGDLDDSGGSVDSDSYSGSLYGTYYLGEGLYVDGIVTGGVNQFDSRRQIRYAVPAVDGGITAVNQTATADTDGPWISVGASVGYDFHVAKFTLGPLARIHYTNAEVNGYQESISGSAPGSGLALNVDDQRVESLVTTLGGQVSYAISTPVAVLVPQVRAEWHHEFLNDSRAIRATFLNDPTPSARTTIEFDTDQPDRDYFTIGVGVAATFRRGVSAFIYYETVLGLQDVTEHQISGGIRVEF
jgi:outer membrane lipase/esterase